MKSSSFNVFFFFNDTATTEIYTLSLHDALPISHPRRARTLRDLAVRVRVRDRDVRSEQHMSELQSPYEIVCRLLLEKKKNILHPLNFLRIYKKIWKLSILSVEI